MNESWHTYQWVMAHINESWHTYQWFTPSVSIMARSHMNESWHTYQWVVAHIPMIHTIHTMTQCNVRHDSLVSYVFHDSLICALRLKSCTYAIARISSSYQWHTNEIQLKINTKIIHIRKKIMKICHGIILMICEQWHTCMVFLFVAFFLGLCAWFHGSHIIIYIMSRSYVCDDFCVISKSWCMWKIFVCNMWFFFVYT